ncbi:MAG TPA: hypothetical protein VGO52_24165 [Hyphomonadaceae bacterium]|jgi:hypothetical protein|nr:hypothetical protein [Hyphomonadaceae bacterium]
MSSQKPTQQPGVPLLPRIAIVAGLVIAATSIGASTVVFEKAFAQQAPGLGVQSYLLKCWQDSVQIVNVRENQALQSLTDPSAHAITLENADGSRRVLAPMGDSLCVLEFTASRN